VDITATCAFWFVIFITSRDSRLGNLSPKLYAQVHAPETRHCRKRMLCEAKPRPMTTRPALKAIDHFVMTITSAKVKV
jgi:hypothetical protein